MWMVSHCITKGRRGICVNEWTAATLDRYEVPFFGPLASSILDDE
jgi:hypothetical protein